MSRLLKPLGWWAAWWNHPWADEEAWFDQYYRILETTCPGFSRDQRNIDWCAEAIAAHGTFEVPQRHIFPWERRQTIELWLTDLRSHSYVMDLPPAQREKLLREIKSILSYQFPDGNRAVAYQTRLWMARRV